MNFDASGCVMAHYYPVTITEVRRVLRDPSALWSPTMTQHLLKMCDQIDHFDVFSLAAALKAARWIGWILAEVEQRDHWPNSVSRDLIRADVLHGHDRPLKFPL